MTFQTPASVPVVEEAENDITNDGFFPNIILAEAREKVRIEGTITPARLREQLIEAISTTNDELANYQMAQLVAGYDALSDVPCVEIDGKSKLVHRYLRAVYCLAKANLIERYRDYDSTNEGNKRADDLDTTINDLRRDYRWAVNDLMGISRSTIELI